MWGKAEDNALLKRSSQQFSCTLTHKAVLNSTPCTWLNFILLLYGFEMSQKNAKKK